MTEFRTRASRVHPRIVAHRGYTAGSPENTLASLSAARRLGCAAVEFDVRETADGHWVVHHDPGLSRMHGLDLQIGETDLAGLREAAHLPTLAEALAVLRAGCRPMVEVKEESPRHLERLARDLSGAALLEPIVIVRGDLPAALRSLLPCSIPIYLFLEDWEEAFRRCEEPFEGFDLPHEPIDPEMIVPECARFREREKALAVWTVNDQEQARRWLEGGADWVITDHPDKFSRVER